MARCAERDDDLLSMNEYAVRGMQAVSLSRHFRYETTQFAGNRGLRVIFRKLGQDEKEHWLNHFAAALTASLVPSRRRWSINAWRIEREGKN